MTSMTPDNPSESQKIYWAEFILQLRGELGWSQSRLAEALRTDQTTASRWERSLMLPRTSVRRELETLATKVGLLTLSQVAAFVKASPFPIIVVDQAGQVVAASSVSGFVEGRGVKEQTPIEQHQTLDRFKAGLAWVSGVARPHRPTITTAPRTARVRPSPRRSRYAAKYSPWSRESPSSLDELIRGRTTWPASPQNPPLPGLPGMSDTQARSAPMG